MTPGTPLTEQDFELLSSYLDSQLAESARVELEARLAAEPALQDALESLRQTVALLKAVPPLTPPRNFTLDPSKYRRAVPWWARYRDIQFVGALGTVASIVLIALGLLSATSLSSYAPAPASRLADKSAAGAAGGPALENGIVAAVATATASPTLLDYAQGAPGSHFVSTTLPNTNLPNTRVASTSVALAPTQVVNAAIPGGAASGFAATPTATPAQAANGAAPAPEQQSAGAAAIAPKAQSLATNSPSDNALAAAPSAKSNSDEQADQAARNLNTFAPSMTAVMTATAISAAKVLNTPAPSMTAMMTATAINTATNTVANTAAPTATPGVTAVAIASGDISSTTPPSSSLPEFLLAFGFGLFVLSVMLLGIGLMRSRLKESR